MAQSPVLSKQPAQKGAEAVRYSRGRIISILAGLMLAMLTSALTNSIVGTALPTIIGELGGQDKLAWVASASLLTMTASTPLWGKLSDIYGRKPLFQLSLVVFITGSVAAGFAADIYWLIGARLVQGLGIGGLATLPQVVLGDVVAPRERGRYSGFLGAVFGVATVAGPLLGGFLVDSPLGWRWCFFITIPLAVVAFTVIQRVLKLPRVERAGVRIDWWGTFFIVAAASSAMLLLSLGGHEFAWRSPPAYLFGATVLLLTGLAILAERRAAHPIMPPHLFRNRTFVLAGGASLLGGMAMFGVIIYFPQYLQVVRGTPPTLSGLMTLPMVAGMLTASITSGLLVSRTGKWKGYPVAGTLLIASGFSVLALLPADAPLALIGTGVGLIGLGLGLTMQILILVTQNALSRADLAAGTSAVSFFRNLGGAVGVAAFGAIMTNTLTSELAAAAPRATAAGSSPAELAAAAKGSPAALQNLPPVLQELVAGVFNAAMHQVFLVGIPIALLAFVLVLLLRTAPLRSGA